MFTFGIIPLVLLSGWRPKQDKIVQGLFRALLVFDCVCKRMGLRLFTLVSVPDKYLLFYMCIDLTYFITQDPVTKTLSAANICLRRT